MVSQRSLAWSLGVMLTASVPSLAQARANEAGRVTPPKKTRKQKREERAQRDLSEGGTRRGIMELSLGAFAATMSVVLIGRGAWELARASTLENVCETPNPPLECELDEPARGNRIGGSLSLAFSVPFAVASGFLFAHGTRIHRDYRKHQQARGLTLAPWAGRHGGGLHMRLRF